ncbi:MAG TPA: fatty acid--CoA ligase [Desulfobacterales bacterium]|nr:fatty acid--CoA ligase [Desulfobacterales bacterium]
MNIPFILEKAISLYENKEAVISQGKRFTYGGFASRVYRLSNLFKQIGLSKGHCIAILHHNSHEFLEAYFAAAQIGAILNPLNFRLSPAELAFVLNDSEATVLIAASRFTSLLQEMLQHKTKVKTLILTGPGEGSVSLPLETLGYDHEIAAQNTPNPPKPNIQDDEIAHLYYTSGTTGKPKGVMLTHKNVCIHALAAIAELGLRDTDVWMHAAPLFHLADAWATFAITWVGGRHVTVPEFKPELVMDTMEKEKVTITNMIPTMLNMLVNTPGIESYDFSSLRVMLSGGAPIAPDVVKRIMETFKCDYIQTYGMTETSPYLTLSILKENLLHLPYDQKFRYKAKTGRPFLGVLLKVVREDGTEVTPNGEEVGEIIVKGDIVTPGYWNNPEETAKAIKDGWLHTGDMAVIDKEGYVNIVDRKKDMIITGGENVYSVEVENVLYKHPAVLEAAVIGVPDSKWGEAVKAVVVLKEGHNATEEELIAFCKERIAHYKAPKSVDFVEELPKTGSGKIYKKGLKDRYWA